MENYLYVLSLILFANFVLDLVMFIKSMTAKHMWELIIPAANNNKEYSVEHHKAWEDMVASISKDIVIIRPLKGDWLTSNLYQFKDKVLRVDVVCNKSQLKQIVAFTTRHYEMDTLVLFRTGEEVIVEKKTA